LLPGFHQFPPKTVVIPSFHPPDSGQKGVDGLRWIGYYFLNSIWQSEILV